MRCAGRSILSPKKSPDIIVLFLLLFCFNLYTGYIFFVRGAGHFLVQPAVFFFETRAIHFVAMHVEENDVQ